MSVEWVQLGIGALSGVLGGQGISFLFRHKFERQAHADTVAVALMKETYARVGVLEQRTDDLENRLTAEKAYTDKLVAHITEGRPPPPPARDRD